MGQPYIGECRLVGFNFQPNGWNLCNGQTVSISEYSTLFQLIGTTYGGDGQQTFQLPDLQGRVPVHMGGGFVIGQRGGTETVTLNVNQLPSHSHTPVASKSAGSNFPSANLPGTSNTLLYVVPASVDSAMNQGMIPSVGGNLPHENMQPFLTMNWVISLFGIFPSQT
jgi:microcystin-dependent protein